MKISNTVSKIVRVSKGLRQEDVFYPFLFNSVLEKIDKEINVVNGVTLGNITICLLAYADDLALLGNCIKLIIYAGNISLKIDDKKINIINKANV